MAGRTHGQHALPVTFGWKCATWLDELMRHRERLLASRPRVLVGEWGGAVGTLAALGRSGLRVEQRLMRQLGLGVPRVPVKTAGDRYAEFFLLLAMLSATLGKIAQHVYNLQVTDVDELSEFVEGKVGSSAMPHKLNPVASGSVVLLGRLLRARAPLALDYVHAEWEDDHRQGETSWAFPQEICLLLSAQLAISARLLERLIVKAGNMRRNLDRARRRRVVRGRDDGARCRSSGAARRTSSSVGSTRESQRQGVPFQEAVRRSPEVRAHASARRIAQALDYRRSLGLCGVLVDACSATGAAGERAPGNDGRLAARRTASRPAGSGAAGSRRCRRTDPGSPRPAGPPRSWSRPGSPPRC
jgi:adenylosuccinate lyase